MRNILFPLIAALALGTAAHAQIIAINFTGGNGSTITAQTGVVLVNDDQWNELAGAASTVDNLNVTDGTTGSSVSGLDVTYFSYDPYQTGNTSLGNLLNGYLDGNGSALPSGDGTITVSLTNIPFAQYDVYAYVGADHDGRPSTASIGSETLSFTTAAVAASSFSVNSDPNAVDPSATTLLFANVSGSSFTYTQDGKGNNGSTGLLGLEIVEIPEPGTVGMMTSGVLLIGGLAWLTRRHAVLARA